MASKTLRTEYDQPVIDMAELGARIARRRAELGITGADIPRNSGAPHGEQEGAVEGDQGCGRGVVRGLGLIAPVTIIRRAARL